MESVPIILVRFLIVKYVNESLQLRFVAVYVAQGLVLLPNTINILDTEGVVKEILVALHIDGEFVGQNVEKLMGYNTGSSFDIGFIVFVLPHNSGDDGIHQSEDGRQ